MWTALSVTNVFFFPCVCSCEPFVDNGTDRGLCRRPAEAGSYRNHRCMDLSFNEAPRAPAASCCGPKHAAKLSAKGLMIQAFYQPGLAVVYDIKLPTIVAHASDTIEDREQQNHNSMGRITLLGRMHGNYYQAE